MSMSALLVRCVRLSVLGALVVPATAVLAAPMFVYGVNANGERVAHVSYADLNLATKAGHDRLNTRVRVAAKAVCATGMRGAGPAFDEAQCVHAAQRAIGDATLAAIAANHVAG